MSVETDIQNNSQRTVESYVANASHASSGTYRVDGTSEVTYDFSGFLVLADATISDVSGFDTIHQNWANDDTVSAGYFYPISGSAITLSAGTVLLIAK